MPLSDRVRSMLNGPESLNVEFKSKVGGLYPEDITAFANARGGTILIGVMEKKRDTGECFGELVGIPSMDGAMASLLSVISACNPKLETAIAEEVSDDGKSVLVVDIPEGKAKPYWTHKGLYVIRRAGRNDALDPLQLRDIMAGTHEFAHYQVPSLLIADDGEATVPASLFLGYRFLTHVSVLWQAVLEKAPAAMELLKERSHRDERDFLVAATLEASIIRWLCLQGSLSVYMDGRPSPTPPRVMFDESVEKVGIDLNAVPELISGNRLLACMGGDWGDFIPGASIVVPKGFALSIMRMDPSKGPFSTLRIHGPEGEIAFSIFRLQGARGIPANVPQLVQVGPKIAQRFWMDMLVTVIETQFQRPSRERPHIEVYRTWAQDLVSGFRLEFDWDDYTKTLPDKEAIRTQMLVEQVLRILNANPQEPKSLAR